MQLLDVRPDLLQIVQEILQKHVPERAVWAFGSRAKWLTKENSDLDLCIVGETPLSFTTLGLLKEAFEESDLPWKVDVVDWATTSESFRKIIERDKVVVQGGKKGLGVESEWKECRLGDVLSFANGKTSPDRIENGHFFVFGSNGTIGRSNLKNSPENTIVIGRVGSYCGSTFFSQFECWVTDNAIRANAKAGSDAVFAYYLLQTLNLNERRAGSGQPLLNQSILSTIDVRVPPPEEQRTIAHILGTLDDKIELNRKQNKTLEVMARTLFKAWFVDFEPVRAKMEGRWQRGQSLPGLPARLYDNFPDRLVDSEWGELPDGWYVTSLSEYSSLNPESWTKRTRPEQIRYVDLSNTKWGRVECVTNYDADDAPSRAQRVLRPLDTLVGTVRPGNGSYARISDEGLTGSTGFAVLRPLRRECSELVYLAATSRENIERLSNLADGGAYPAVRPEIVSATQVPRIGQELINEFSQQVSPMLAGMAYNERTSQSLALLRDALLPKLISGELRIEDAEEFLKRANP
jgi:type I restriction enzyme, S subunit